MRKRIRGKDDTISTASSFLFIYWKTKGWIVLLYCKEVKRWHKLGNKIFFYSYFYLTTPPPSLLPPAAYLQRKKKKKNQVHAGQTAFHSNLVEYSIIVFFLQQFHKQPAGSRIKLFLSIDGNNSAEVDDDRVKIWPFYLGKVYAYKRTDRKRQFYQREENNLLIFATKWLLNYTWLTYNTLDTIRYTRTIQ